jgi:hypothetical protein
LWSYNGPGTVGYANPEGEDAEADSFESLLATASEMARPQTLREHVRWLAENQRLVDRYPSDWVSGLLPSDARLGEEDRDEAVAWGTFASAVARAGGSWLVLSFGP